MAGRYWSRKVSDKVESLRAKYGDIIDRLTECFNTTGAPTYAWAREEITRLRAEVERLSLTVESREAARAQYLEEKLAAEQKAADLLEKFESQVAAKCRLAESYSDLLERHVAIEGVLQMLVDKRGHCLHEMARHLLEETIGALNNALQTQHKPASQAVVSKD